MQPTISRSILARTLGLLILSALPTSFAEAPQRIASMEEATAIAEETWTQNDGAFAETRRQGAARAATRTGSPLSSLDFETSPGFPIADDVGRSGEAYASLTFDVGAARRRATAAYRLQADAIASEDQAARWLYVSEAQALYAEFVALTQVTQSLEADLADLEALIARWRGPARDHVAALDVLDAEAERILLQQTLTESRLDTQSAEAAFVGHIGSSLVLAAPATSGPISAHNPWLALAAQDVDFAQLRAMEARAQLAEAEAKRDRARQYELSVGAWTTWADQRGESVGPYVALSIPISPTAGGEVAIAQAEAVAIRGEIASIRSSLQAWAAAEAVVYDNTLRALTQVESTSIPQLQTRLDALAQAHTQGHIPAQRMLLARRDLLEAQRQATRLRARLAQSRATARGLLALVD